MAQVPSLRSVWEMTDNSYIQATRSGSRNPAGRRHLSDEMNRSERAQSVSGSECDDSCSQKSFGDFVAIPEEFRPTKKGRDLLKVRASPKKGDSNVKVNSEERHRNERYPVKPNISIRKGGIANSNSSAAQNESCYYKKESLKIEKSEKPQRDSDLSADETGKQKKMSGMFFHDSSSENTPASRANRERPPYRSGKENNESEWPGKNIPDEKTPNQFFNSDNSRSKVKNKVDNDSFFAQKKEEINFPKFNKNATPKFQGNTASSQNKASFEEKGAEKVTRETTVTKRIQWKNDLCRFKKPENKQNVFYEYTKTTKESVSCISSHCGDDEPPKRPHHGFEKERNRMFSEQHQSDPKLRYEKGFDSNYKTPRREARRWTPNRPGNRREERRNCFHNANGKDTIIVKHEIKVIHVNGQSKGNRMHHNASRKIRPPKKDGNGKIINAGTRIHFEAMRDKTGKSTMTKTTEGFQITRKNNVEPTLKSTDLIANTVHDHDAISRTSNVGSKENLTTLLWYGREISDLIAGCYVAISTFLDNYEQWKDFRRVTMLLFEEFEKSLSQSCSNNKNQRIIEVAEMIGTGCKMVQFVPHPGVSIAAKVIAVISEVVSKMFSSSKSAKSIGMDDFQLRLCLQKDMDATSDIYLYGIQCDTQFQETCELIEKFHGEIQDGLFNGFVETFETGFLKKISLLSPKHPDVFYKGLGRFYNLLNDNQQSEEGEAFCRAFKDWPDALTTISRLHRRFRKENWDSSSVVKAWEEIYNLLQNDKSVVEDVLKKVQDCICVLMKEQIIMDKYVMDLKRQS